MIEKDEFRELIAGIVREEIKMVAEETNDLIAEVVREELIPVLRSAIRDSIEKEMRCAASDEQHASDEHAACKENDAPLANHQTLTCDDTEKTIKAGDGQGLYLYGLADTSVFERLGKIGIDGCEVYTIPHEGLSAIVHNSPVEPYKSDDDEIVKRWVKTHQQVMDIAAERFGNIMPFSFDTIIMPKDNATAKETLMGWLSSEHEEIMKKMDRIKGKKEYGVQIFYTPSVVSERIEKESEEIRRIRDEMASKPSGLAYMYKQKLENAVKVELDKLMDAYFKDFYGKIRRSAEDIKVEKVKKADDKRVMMMNLSVLASDEKALGQVLDEIEREEGISIRFTGPWQPYSFI